MIAVLLATYSPEGSAGPRADYARRTMRSLVQHLHAGQPLRLHVADDGSPECAFVSELLMIAEHGWGTEGSWTGGERVGIGGNINRALAVIPEDTILLLPDDLALVDDVDLRLAELLLANGYHYVRLDTPGSGLRCETRWDARIGWWLNVDSTSPGYVFALLPALASRRFFTQLGPLLEHASTEETERDYADRLREAEFLDVAFDNTFLRRGPWDHIGAVTVGRRAGK